MHLPLFCHDAALHLLPLCNVVCNALAIEFDLRIWCMKTIGYTKRLIPLALRNVSYRADGSDALKPLAIRNVSYRADGSDALKPLVARHAPWTWLGGRIWCLVTSGFEIDIIQINIIEINIIEINIIECQLWDLTGCLKTIGCHSSWESMHRMALMH